MARKGLGVVDEMHQISSPGFGVWFQLQEVACRRETQAGHHGLDDVKGVRKDLYPQTGV